MCTCLDGLDADVIPVERLVRTFAETGQRPQMTFRGIFANLLQSPVLLKTVAHSHIPWTWFELQRVKCSLRLAWIWGASRAALFSPPIVFFVKSCSLLLDFFLGSLDHIKGLMKC